MAFCRSSIWSHFAELASLRTAAFNKISSRLQRHGVAPFYALQQRMKNPGKRKGQIGRKKMIFFKKNLPATIAQFSIP
jgi:hypothetical protein